MADVVNGGGRFALSLVVVYSLVCGHMLTGEMLPDICSEDNCSLDKCSHH